jgi:hypothetical protein
VLWWRWWGQGKGFLLVLRATRPRSYRAVGFYVAWLAVVEAEALVSTAVPLFLGDALTRS